MLFHVRNTSYIVPQGISGQKASIYEFAQCLQTVGGAGVKVGQM